MAKILKENGIPIPVLPLPSCVMENEETLQEFCDWYAGDLHWSALALTEVEGVELQWWWEAESTYMRDD